MNFGLISASIPPPVAILRNFDHIFLFNCRIAIVLSVFYYLLASSVKIYEIANEDSDFFFTIGIKINF